MGDVGSVRALSARFQHRADDLRALNTELTQGLAGLGGWHGQAADRFRENQQRLRLGLDEFVVRFERCRVALDSYAHQMDARRQESNALLPRVLDAQRRLADAQRQILHPTSADALSRALAVQPWILNELKNLGGVWFRIRAAQDASSLWCGQQLQDSDGTLLRDLFHDAFSIAGSGWTALVSASNAGDRWFRENAETIKSVSEFLGDLGFLCGMLERVPELAPFAPVLALVGLGFSLASLDGLLIADQYGAHSSDAELLAAGAAILLGLLGLGAGRAGKAKPVIVWAGKREQDVELLKNAFESALGDGIVQRIERFWSPRPASNTIIPPAPGPTEDPADQFWKAVEAGRDPRLKLGASDARRTVTEQAVR